MGLTRHAAGRKEPRVIVGPELPRQRTLRRLSRTAPPPCPVPTCRRLYAYILQMSSFRPSSYHCPAMSLVKPALLSQIRTCLPQVLDIWFEGVAPNVQMPPAEALRRWWGAGRTAEQNKAFNDMCRTRFGSVLNEMEKLPVAKQSSAIVAELESISGYKSILALILLLDQMPRCILGASSPLVYTQYDPLAQVLSRNAIRSGLDAKENADSLPWRFWFYLPLEHSEDIEDHRRVAHLFEQLKGKDDSQYYDYAGNAAKEHREIIEQFGRYPYRNECLKRSTTEEEAQWLQEHGNPFATK